MPEPAPQNDVTRVDPRDGPATATRERQRFPDGAALGRYRLVARLGEGGMGVVYRAHDPKLARDVALKVLHPHAARSEAARARLRQEARALAEVSHPNVVQVYDVGEDRGAIFIGMELVPGIDLRRWLERERRPWPAALELLLAAGRGLAAAHDRGLVHRDFKPANVLVGDDGRARVVDFGLACLTEDGHAALEATTGASLRSGTLTESGVALGTPLYMAPEQHLGHGADARSDQYAFCISAWEGLYGQRPFTGTTLEELLLAKECGAPRPPPGKHGVPRRVAAVLQRGLRAAQAERWPDMSSLLAALERAARPRRTLAWVGAAVLVAGGAAAAAQALGGQRGTSACPPAAERLDGVWDDARQQRLRHAIEDSGLPYADATWSRVKARLDAQAVQWAESHDRACAARADGSADPTALDLRMLCLDDRRDELASLVDVIVERAADHEAVRRAVEAVGELRSPLACDTPRGARFAASGDQAELDAFRRDLLRAESLGKLARHDEGLVLAEAVLVRATADELPVLRAEALLVAGQLEKGKAAPEDAQRHLSEAAMLAVSLDRDDVAARAAIELVDVEGLGRSRYDDALEWNRHAQAAIERLGRDPILEARRLTSLGNLELARGHTDAALAAFEASLALVREAFGEGHPRLASAQSDVGNALVRAGRYEEALAATRAALAAGEQAFGATHPEVGVMHGRLAMAWLRQGDYDKAAEHSQRAIEILRESLGPAHPNVAVMMTNLGMAEQRRGRLAEAEAAFRHALPSLAGSINEAIVLSSLCDLAREQGDDAAALVHARRSRELREALLGPEDMMVAMGLLAEGLALSRVDRHDEALAALARARSMHERRPLPPNYAAVLDAYEGRAHLRAGHSADALSLLERALAQQEQLGAEPIDRADVRFHIAQALWAMDRKDEARAQLAVVEAELAPLGARADHRRQPIHAWMEQHGVDRTSAPGSSNGTPKP